VLALRHACGIDRDSGAGRIRDHEIERHGQMREVLDQLVQQLRVEDVQNDADTSGSLRPQTGMHRPCLRES
jgi:hypothetical protein